MLARLWRVGRSMFDVHLSPPWSKNNCSAVITQKISPIDVAELMAGEGESRVTKLSFCFFKSIIILYNRFKRKD